jgi:MSHA biogenesis protein MshI
MKIATRKFAKPGLCCAGITASGVALAYIAPTAHGLPQLSICRFVAGDINNAPATLAELVKEHELKNMPCACLLNSGDYKLLPLEGMAVAPEELNAAARWKIKDLLDFPIAEATIDCFQLPILDPQSKQKRAYAVAAHTLLLEKMAQLIRSSGLHLANIDIPELALTNLCVRFAKANENVGLLLLQETSAKLIICRQDNVCFMRTIEFQAVEKLGLEIQRSLDYYQSELRQGELGQLLVAPNAHAALPYLTEYLYNSKLTVLNLAQAVSAENVIDSHLQARCLTVIGGALRGVPRAATN